MISPPPARKSKTLIATSANKQTKGEEKRLDSFKQKWNLNKSGIRNFIIRDNKLHYAPSTRIKDGRDTESESMFARDKSERWKFITR